MEGSADAEGCAVAEAGGAMLCERECDREGAPVGGEQTGMTQSSGAIVTVAK